MIDNKLFTFQQIYEAYRKAIFIMIIHLYLLEKNSPVSNLQY